MAVQAKEAMHVGELEAVADRGYFNGEKIRKCTEAGITVTLPKPIASGSKSKGRFGKDDFVYLPEVDVYRCPAGENLSYRYTTHSATVKMRMGATHFLCTTLPEVATEMAQCVLGYNLTRVIIDAIGA
jgi:hypothetical protein